MDEKKHPNSSQSERENQKVGGAGKTTTPSVANRSVFSKRWLYPAIYLGAAALIIGLMYVKSQVSTAPTAAGIDNAPTTAQATNQPVETFAWPVAQGTAAKVTLGAFPLHGTAAQQAAALVNYDNSYTPHKGLDIKADSGSAFTATASVSGTVTAVDKNPLEGWIVQVNSADGYQEEYESLADASVHVGQAVQQGQAVGTTGSNLYEANQGNHLFFEVMKAGEYVDPSSLVKSQS